MVDFLQLCRSDIFVAFFKISTGITHAVIEPEPVELIRHIVMEADCFGIFRLAAFEGAPETPELPLLLERLCRQFATDCDDFAGFSKDVDMPIDIRAAQIRKRWCKQVAQGGGLLNPDVHSRRCRAQLEMFAIP